MLPIIKIPTVVETYSSTFKDVFTPEGNEHFKRYIAGLLMSNNKTVEGMNKLFVLDVKDQSSMNRFMNQSPWDKDELNRQRINWLQTCPQTAMKVSGEVRGVLVLDDTMFEHTGKHFENISKLFDHASGQKILAHNVVNLHYVDDVVDYPIGFQLWVPPNMELVEEAILATGLKFTEKKQSLKTTAPIDYRRHLLATFGKLFHKGKIEQVYITKLELAKIELKSFFDQHGNPDLPITFDSWFASPYFLKYIDQDLDKAYVSALKPSEILLVRGDEKVTATDFAKELKKSHFQLIAEGKKGLFDKVGIGYKGKKEYYYSYCGTHNVKKFGRQRLVINFKEENLSDEPKFIISNRLTWHSAGITRIYRHRWHIEVYHEEAKDEGLAKYQLRDFEAIKKHIALVITAYSYLQRFRFDQELLQQLQWKPKLSEIDNSLRFWRRVLNYEALITIIYWFMEKDHPPSEIQRMVELLKHAYM